MVNCIIIDIGFLLILVHKKFPGSHKNGIWWGRKGNLWTNSWSTAGDVQQQRTIEYLFLNHANS